MINLRKQDLAPHCRLVVPNDYFPVLYLRTMFSLLPGWPKLAQLYENKAELQWLLRRADRRSGLGRCRVVSRNPASPSLTSFSLQITRSACGRFVQKQLNSSSSEPIICYHMIVCSITEISQTRDLRSIESGRSDISRRTTQLPAIMSFIKQDASIADVMIVISG